MKRTALSFAAALAIGLAGCGQQSPVENKAELLEEAAEQSTPEAAAVLENAAEQGANVQEAMQAAGNAQVAGQAKTPAPPVRQAKPHAKGDPVPPPKVKPAEEAATGEDQGNHSGH